MAITSNAAGSGFMLISWVAFDSTTSNLHAAYYFEIWNDSHCFNDWWSNCRFLSLNESFPSKYLSTQIMNNRCANPQMVPVYCRFCLVDINAFTI